MDFQNDKKYSYPSFDLIIFIYSYANKAHQQISDKPFFTPVQKGRFFLFSKNKTRKYLYIYIPNIEILLSKKNRIKKKKTKTKREKQKTLGGFGLFCKSFIPRDKEKNVWILYCLRGTQYDKITMRFIFILFCQPSIDLQNTTTVIINLTLSYQ